MKQTFVVESSDLDRAIQSTAYTMAGMFETRINKSQNDTRDESPGLLVPSSIPQMVPIHTIPSEIDHKLHYKHYCKLYEKIFNETVIPKIEESLEKLRTIGEYIENHSGKPMYTDFDYFHIYDTLYNQNRRHYM